MPRSPRLPLLMALLAVLHTLPALAEVPAPGSVRLVCGGIGSDESSRMLAEQKQHALTLLFAAQEGSYVYDVRTRIETPAGILLAEQKDCGPIGQVDVAAPGQYILKTSFAGQQQEHPLTLQPAAGQRLVLRWKAD